VGPSDEVQAEGMNARPAVAAWFPFAEIGYGGGQRLVQLSSPMSFLHPLARSAKVWTASDRNGDEQRVLVVSTTIPLDPTRKSYKKLLVERLSTAVREHLAATSEASLFLLMNQPREWRGE